MQQHIHRGLGVVLTSSLLAISLPAQASTFNIQLNFGGGLTTSEEAVFTKAENFWESVITGYKGGSGISSVAISASGSTIDGVGGVLGQAGPDSYFNQGGYAYIYSGSMQFDSADLAFMETNGILYGVILHEMAHVLGFGTLWTLNGVYSDGSGKYTGSAALAEYKLEFDSSATSVPVELGGSSGTANSHWNEVDGGSGNTGIVGVLPGSPSYGKDFKNELMTGWVGAAPFVSLTTIASFADLGYTVNLAADMVVPEPGTLALLSLAGVLAGFRRKGLALN